MKWTGPGLFCCHWETRLSVPSLRETRRALLPHFNVPHGPNDTTSFNIHFAFTSQYKAVTPRGPASHDQALPGGMAPGIAISVAALLLDA